MNLKGVIVNHIIFGEGIIKDYDENYITISFSQGEKMFVYPDAFEKYLSVENDEIKEFINLEIEKKKYNNEEPTVESNSSLSDDEFKKLIESIINEFFSKEKENLPNIKKEQTEEIKNIVSNRGIEHLVHFTRIENLNSILQYGLVPVILQEQMGINSVRNDEQRIDSKLDCTSCSITFPNYRLFYKFREYDYPGTRWVVLAIDKSILFSPSNITFFCYTNAARVIPQTRNLEDLCTVNAFKNMFCDTIIINGRRVRRELLNINDNFTTDPQAEILISDIIDKEYINCIYFQNEDDLQYYKENYGLDILKKYNYDIDRNFFDARTDYDFWGAVK